MSTWILVLWSWTVPPILGGEYLDLPRCEASAAVQVVGLHDKYGKLRWRCLPSTDPAALRVKR
jgi:hypothetical protein